MGYVTVLKGLHDPCVQDIQCSESFGPGRRCHTRCVCRDDFHEVNNECVENKGIKRRKTYWYLIKWNKLHFLYIRPICLNFSGRVMRDILVMKVPRHCPLDLMVNLRRRVGEASESWETKSGPSIISLNLVRIFNFDILSLGCKRLV